MTKILTNDFTEETQRLLDKANSLISKPVYRFVQKDTGEKEIADSDSENKEMIVQGYAAIFNSLSEDLGGWREVLLPGCFKMALARDCDCRALLNHNHDAVLGRTKSGTLELTEDEKGLFFKLHLPPTTIGKDLYESIKRGDITQCSFGFSLDLNCCKFKDDPKHGRIRYIRSIYELFDISIVAFPAYLATSVDIVRQCKQIAKQSGLREECGNLTNQIIKLQNTVRYDKFNSINDVLQLSHEKVSNGKALSRYDMAVLGQKLDKLCSQPGDTAEIRNLRHKLLKAKIELNLKKKNISLGCVKTLSEAYYLDKHNLIDRQQLIEIARRFKLAYICNYRPPRTCNSEFRLFPLKMLYYQNGMAEEYDEKVRRERICREMEKEYGWSPGTVVFPIS